MGEGERLLPFQVYKNGERVGAGFNTLAWISTCPYWPKPLVPVCRDRELAPGLVCWSRRLLPCRRF